MARQDRSIFNKYAAFILKMISTVTWYFTYLFIKELRPRDREGTFAVAESSFHLLIPV